MDMSDLNPAKWAARFIELEEAHGNLAEEHEALKESHEELKKDCSKIKRNLTKVRNQNASLEKVLAKIEKLLEHPTALKKQIAIVIRDEVKKADKRGTRQRKGAVS